MSSPIPLIRRLIWLYCLLWVFEGALRFWVLPGLQGPLTLIRDPLVIAIYLLALPAKVFPMNGYVTVTMLLALVSFPLAIVAGHGNVTVAAYGLRANFLHLPLIFVIAEVFTGRDIKQVMRWALILAIPMAFLAVRQFQSPNGSLINKGGMHTHYGSVRPAGTFSFVSAMVYFMTLVAASSAWRLIQPARTWGLLVFAAAAALVAMVAVSGSRTAVVSVAVVGLLALAAGFSKTQQAARLIFGLVLIGLAAAFVSSAELIETGIDQLERRFDDASGGKNLFQSSWDRFAESTMVPLGRAFDRDWAGEGLGFGTNVGGSILTGSRHGFLVGESEWDRLLGELGPILGLIFIFLRLGMVLEMAKLTWRWGVNQGQPLPMLLFGVAALPMLAGQWGVASLQGFASISAGLFFASVKVAVRQARDMKVQRQRIRALRAEVLETVVA
jgi:hypothetical protein